jgi:cation diffusion facilitator CzcD-associated flavoprotein CzcO
MLRAKRSPHIPMIRAADTRTKSNTARGSVSPSPRVAILGAGFGGICMAIQLKKAGFHDFTLYEKAGAIGGTWRDNTYPGAACDVRSHLYSFSFELNPDWSRSYASQPEILHYLEHCVDKYGLRPHLRFHTELESARFDASRGVWRLRARGGQEMEADIVVSAVGQLNRPHTPSLPGLESFSGTRFHSARWNHAHDLSGERVAVIGNGASAIQFVPEIAPRVGKLLVFQRSPTWLISKKDRAMTKLEKGLFRRFPRLAALHRKSIHWELEARFFAFRQDSFLSKLFEQVARWHLRRQVSNPELRKALTPGFPIGCKRVLLSDDYYPALQRENVELVTHGIERIEGNRIVTREGRTHEVDTLIFATGFEATSFLAPIRFEGLGGRTLHEEWKDGAEAYLGLAVPGFPNFYMLYGPNTNLGHNSIISMIECQTRYIVQCLEAMRERELLWLDVKPEAMRAFNTELRHTLSETVWAANCGSWYKTASGKITNNWSGFVTDYERLTRHPDWRAFHQEARPPVLAAVG